MSKKARTLDTSRLGDWKDHEECRGCGQTYMILGEPSKGSAWDWQRCLSCGHLFQSQIKETSDAV